MLPSQEVGLNLFHFKPPLSTGSRDVNTLCYCLKTVMRLENTALGFYYAHMDGLIPPHMDGLIPLVPSSDHDEWDFAVATCRKTLSLKR